MVFETKAKKAVEQVNRALNYLVSNLLPYILPIVAIVYLSGAVFIATQSVLPYINQNGQIIVIYPGTTSQQTILETFLVAIILLFSFFSLLGLYIVGSRRYHAKPPTPLLSLSLFLFFILFFILMVMLLPKAP